MCDNHANTRSHLTHACNIYRRANGLVVHPWLVHSEGSANRAHAENEDEIFGSHPDDALEVISDADHSLNQPSETQQGGLLACTVTLASGVLSSDNEEYCWTQTSVTDLTQRSPLKI